MASLVWRERSQGSGRLRHTAASRPPPRRDAMSITDDQRARVSQELPQITEIADAKLRDLVVEAWATALGREQLRRHRRYPAVRESGNAQACRRHASRPYLRRDAPCHLARGRAAAAVSGASPSTVTFSSPARCATTWASLGNSTRSTRRAGKASPGKTGRPSIRHPAYGVHICLTVGLPEAVAHMAGAHSGEGGTRRAQPREHHRPPRRLRILGGGQGRRTAHGSLGGRSRGRVPSRLSPRVWRW